MKRFLICKVRADGRREIHDHTDLSSEVLRFEALGYDVVPRSEAARLATKATTAAGYKTGTVAA